MKRNLPSEELIQAFRKVLAAVIRGCMGHNCALHCPIRLMSKPVKNMYGPTLTVQSRGRDNLFFHKALGVAQGGDVIIVVTSFCDTNSVAGGNIAINTTFRKLKGLVFDAPTRDVKGISKMGLPVYATGTIPGGPRKNAPGEVNIPVSYGSCFIYPRDIIVRDMDGVVIVPLGDAEAVLEAAQKYYVTDMHSQEEATAGSWDREWTGGDLKAAGVRIIDGCCRR